MPKTIDIKILCLVIMKKKGLFTELPDGSATFDKRDLKKLTKKFQELMSDELESKNQGGK